MHFFDCKSWVITEYRRKIVFEYTLNIKNYWLEQNLQSFEKIRQIEGIIYKVLRKFVKLKGMYKVLKKFVKLKGIYKVLRKFVNLKGIYKVLRKFVKLKGDLRCLARM